MSVQAVLEARNYPTQIIPNPLDNPARLALRLSSETSVSQLVWDQGSRVSDNQIAGVLVRSTGWIEPDGWAPDDLAYVLAESQAALLAWLWSLDCPVVNRYPSAIWYQPPAPLLRWHALLRRCGLPTMETLVTNVAEETRTFARRLADEGALGAVYRPFVADVRYLVASDEGWNGIATMHRLAPVCLTYPHGSPQLLAVVGGEIIWDRTPEPELASLEPLLRCFAASAGLAFVEMAFAETGDAMCVIAVEPRPQLDHFSEATRLKIVEGVVSILTAETRHGRKDTSEFSKRLL